MSVTEEFCESVPPLDSHDYFDQIEIGDPVAKSGIARLAVDRRQHLRLLARRLADPLVRRVPP